jgi:RNA polymerase sigma factor (sigma-70 family)
MLDSTDGIARALGTLRDFSAARARPTGGRGREDAWRTEFIAALERRSELLKRLAEIDEPERAVLVLRYVAGLGAAEISRMLGVSRSSFYRLKERALERMARAGSGEEVRSLTA